MLPPTIHLNGTEQDALMDAVCQAGLAVGAAMRKVAAMAPNARDYYPQGPDAISRAIDSRRRCPAER